jgi:hypothetical protein
LPTIPDKPPKNAATPVTIAELRKRPYVSPIPDPARAKAMLDEAWAIINAEET